MVPSVRSRRARVPLRSLPLGDEVWPDSIDLMKIYAEITLNYGRIQPLQVDLTLGYLE